MSHIFLSYAREDRLRVLPLVQALAREGWSVWWDRDDILPGKSFEQVIDEALSAAGCVIVVWSRASVASHWVRDEADEGRQRDILIPVLIDDVRIPYGFRQFQTARLTDWHEGEPHQEFDKLVRAVTHLIGPPPKQEATQELVDVGPSPHRQAPQPGEEGVVPPSGAERITNSIGMEFVRIPAGEFQMGSKEGDDDERPVHRVIISRPFYLGVYEVTQAQWEEVMGENPSRFKGDPNRPVENVSWEDVQEFIRRLNTKEGSQKYRLPTEAEWEYAARAGSKTPYCFGDDSGQLGEYGWYDANSRGQTHPVGRLKPNDWGLYDMHGNVWEWVQGWYGDYPDGPVTDPQGPSSGSGLVIRGGSWEGGARGCRSAARGSGTPGSRDGALGFRLLRTAP